MGDLPDSNLNDPACATSAGKCTLRAAIAQINFTGDSSNTIDFSGSLSYPGTILLTSVLPVITRSITINGPGPDRLTIDAQDLYRMFAIDTTAGNGSLVLSGMRLIRGTTVSGGAVFVDIGDSAALKHMIFENNNVTTYGGAVYCNQCGSLSISHSRFSNNSATSGGGGVYAASTVINIDHTVFEGNAQTAAVSSGSGGGMSIGSSTGSITDSVFDGNVAGGYGGGLKFSGIAGGTFAIRDSSFIGNSAAGGGGGIYLWLCESVVFERITVSGNTAVSDGGGIFTLADVSVSIVNSTISGNSSSSRGGGIYSGGALQLLNTTLSGNHAATSGGALRTGGPANAVNTIFTASTGSSNCSTPINGTNSHNIDFGGPAPANSCGAAITADPMLGSLRKNGGPTLTMAPGVGSAAIEAGDTDNYPATDQRGWPRPYSTTPDIGAVEDRPGAKLTVNVSGKGTIASTPAGISCSTGCGSDSSLFPLNSSVSLFALPDAGTVVFHPGWSGLGCGSTVSMTAPQRTCTATFTECKGNPVKWLITYPSIMDAYAARVHSVRVSASNRMELLDLDDTFQFTINGGYDCDFNSVVDYTYVNGRILVRNGSVVLDRVVIL